MHGIDRYYRLPVSPSCSVGCSYCMAIGALADSHINLDAIRERIDAIKKTRRREVLLPCNFVLHPEAQSVLTLLQENGLRPIIEVNSRLGRERMRALRDLVARAGCEINYILDDCEAADLDGIYFLETHAESVFYTVIARRNIDLKTFLRRLPSFVQKKTHLYFPYKGTQADEFFTEDEMFILLEELRAEFPEFTVRPQRGVSVYEYGPVAEGRGRSIELRQLYRNTLNQELYRKNQTQMGAYPRLRAFAAFIAKPGWTRAFTWIFFPIVGLSWLFVDFSRSVDFLYWHGRRFLDWLERRWIAMENIARSIFWWAYPFYRKAVGFLRYCLGVVFGVLIDTRWVWGRFYNRIREWVIHSYWRLFHYFEEGKGLAGAAGVGVLVLVRRACGGLAILRVRAVWAFYYIFTQMLGDLRKLAVRSFWAMHRSYVSLQRLVIHGAYVAAGGIKKTAVAFYWQCRRAGSATYRLLWQIAYPVRKVFYFLDYQVRKIGGSAS